MNTQHPTRRTSDLTPAQRMIRDFAQYVAQPRPYGTPLGTPVDQAVSVPTPEEPQR